MIVSIALFGAATCNEQKCGFMVVLICFVAIGSKSTFKQKKKQNSNRIRNTGCFQNVYIYKSSLVSQDIWVTGVIFFQLTAKIAKF